MIVLEWDTFLRLQITANEKLEKLWNAKLAMTLETTPVMNRDNDAIIKIKISLNMQQK